MPALSEEVREAEEEGLTIINGLAPFRARGAGGKFLSVDFMKAKVVKDPSGSLRIARVGTGIRSYRTQRVIVAIGQAMEPLHLPRGVKNSNGVIGVDSFCRTDHPKFFAGGDASGGKAFVADAIASGKMAALSMACFLQGRQVEEEFSRLRIGAGRGFSFSISWIPALHRVDLSRAVSFEQVNPLFFTKAARVETAESERPFAGQEIPGSQFRDQSFRCRQGTDAVLQVRNLHGV